MFGYVKAYQPELKCKDYESYKAVYCSLCRELGRRYGLFSRFFLSYDFTFLALVRMALADECPGFRKSRCPFNPLHRCHVCQAESPGVTLAATAAVLLFYYKVRDNLHDAGFWKKVLSALLYPLAALAHNKAVKARPELERAVASAMEQQAALEAERCPDLDRAAEPSARALAAICACDAADEEERRILDRLGYCVGRWVYLIDAADDLEKDRKSGDYNVFLTPQREGGPDWREETIRPVLERTAAEAARALNLLRLRRFGDLLENIVYDGMTDSLNRVFPEKAVRT